MPRDFDKVTAEFRANEVGRFTRFVGDSRSRVAIYKVGIAYIEEAVDVELFVK